MSDFPRIPSSFTETTPPRFFRYDPIPDDAPETYGPTILVAEREVIVIEVDIPTIYGFLGAVNDEDEYHFRSHGRIWGYWFSPLCLEGEAGSHSLSNLVEITETEFKAAFASGWPQLGSRDRYKTPVPTPVGYR